MIVNKNALTASFSLASLEIRLRNEETIYFTWNRIYSLKAFYFLLYQHRYFLFVSELIWYACLRWPEIHLWSQAICMYEYTKIQGPNSWFQRNCIIARDQKSDLNGISFQSSPKINHMLITRPICMQWKFTTPDHRTFAKKHSHFFRPLSSVHLFQSNQRFQPILFGKVLNLIFPKLSSQNIIRGQLDHIMIPIPSFHSLR